MAGGNVSPQLASIFQAAGKAHNIPPQVLAGIASVETNLGANRSTSSAGAVGLMQFEPGTARSVGINPLDDRQAIFGAAKLLNQYGYQANPFRAIGAYNGGPGNPQSGYARQVLSEAHRLGGQVKGGGAITGALSPAPSVSPTQRSATFDQAGFNAASQRANALTAFKAANRANPFQTGPQVAGLSGGDPVLAMLHPSQPNPADYIRAQSGLQGLAGGTVLSAHPAVRASTQTRGNIAGGFLPKGAQYVVGRKDQGRDGQTNPGGPILAPGDGKVIAVKSNPGGFGPAYPVVHFTSGPYAGRTIYFGHTLAAVQPGQQIRAGQTISHTGAGPGGVGNASVPGWFEIGFADSGSPGPMGQAVPF